MQTSITHTDDDLDITTRTAWGEIRNYVGKDNDLPVIAVVWVIRNRAEWTPAAWWGSTPATVCQKRGQFSCWLKSDPNYAKLVALPREDLTYNYIYALVKRIFDGYIDDPTKGATMYKVTGTDAPWDAAVANKDPVIVGPHSFWRLGPTDKTAS